VGQVPGTSGAGRSGVVLWGGGAEVIAVMAGGGGKGKMQLFCLK